MPTMPSRLEAMAHGQKPGSAPHEDVTVAATTSTTKPTACERP